MTVIYVCNFYTFGCVTGWVYNFIFPQSSPVAHNFPLFDLATVLKSVPSIVSGQIPMVLKLKRQVWVAHSTSRNVIGLVIWRHTVAFPKNGCENWRFFLETMYFVVINIFNSPQPQRRRILIPTFFLSFFLLLLLLLPFFLIERIFEWMNYWMVLNNSQWP